MDNDEQPPHNNHAGSLRLPLFWAENSEAWFGIAESRFRLSNIEDEQVKFDLVVNALPKECLRTVLDLVTNPPEEDAYGPSRRDSVSTIISLSSSVWRRSTPWRPWAGGSPLSCSTRCWSYAPLGMRPAHFFSSSFFSVSPTSCASCWVKTTTMTSAPSP
jgi:hypothetical protein